MDMSMAGSNDIVVACEKYWEPYKADCSGFVKAVSLELGVTLTGQANDIVDQIGRAPWVPLTNGVDAAAKSGLGLVVAGLKDNPHGHVVVVVPGPLAHGAYPTAYWGQLGGVGKKNATLNWAWSAADRDRVSYSWRSL
jgi:hypothetical protein